MQWYFMQGHAAKTELQIEEGWGFLSSNFDRYKIKNSGVMVAV